MKSAALSATRLPHKQQGNVAVLFVVSLTALLTMAAVALDTGDLFLNKGRLQNLVDAAALHGARVVDQGGSQTAARQAVVDILVKNLESGDMRQLSNNINLTTLNTADEDVTNKLNVLFLAAPEDNNGLNAAAGRYVRVELGQITLTNFLSQTFSFSKNLSATALAGPSTAAETCFQDVLPVMVCGDAAGTAANLFNLPFGLPPNDVLSLLTMPAANTTPLAIGNIQLRTITAPINTANYQSALAGQLFGEQQVCFTAGTTIATQAGLALAQPLAGLNTRFNGSADDDFPRDNNNCQGADIADNVVIDGQGEIIDAAAIATAYRFEDNYLADIAIEATACSAPSDDGNITLGIQARRRIVRLIIADCAGAVNGENTLPFLGIGCFFLSQKIADIDVNRHLVGEFIDGCLTQSKPSEQIGNVPGPDSLVLYHVPGSTDS